MIILVQSNCFAIRYLPKFYTSATEPVTKWADLGFVYSSSPAKASILNRNYLWARQCVLNNATGHPGVAVIR